MKKRKLTLWLNVATLCLCLATLAFGVYSAKTAHLTTNGTVSFKAHDCQVKVVGTISNAMRSESLNYAQVSDKTYTDDGSGHTVAWADSFTTGENYLTGSDTWTFGDIYFDDMNIGNEEEMQSIIITLQISNHSAFPVKASFTMPSLDANLSTEGSVNEVYVDKMTESTPTTDSLVLKLTVTDKAQDINLQNLNLGVNFEKSEMPAPLASTYGTLSGSTLTVSTSYISPNAKGEIIIPAVVENDAGEKVNVESISMRSLGKTTNKLVFEDGIKSVDLGYQQIKMASLTLPSSVNTFKYPEMYGSPTILEIYNASSNVNIVKGDGVAKNAIAVHTNLNEESIFKTTDDGLTYCVDESNEKAYITDIVTQKSTVTLPTNFEGSDYTIFGDTYGFYPKFFDSFNGKIYVADGCNSYGANGDVLYQKSDNKIFWISGADSLTIPKEANGLVTGSNYNANKIKSSTNIIHVEEGNTTYASNNEGTLVYTTSNGGLVWVSSNSETLNIPAAVGDFSPTLIPSNIKRVYVDAGNPSVASNEEGTLFYSLRNGSAQWVTPDSTVKTLIIPNNVTHLAPSYSYFIPSSVNRVTVEAENTSYGSNSEGTLVYSISDGKVIWVTPDSSVTTLNIPEGVKVFPDIRNKNFISINLPSTMGGEKLGANVPTTVETITVALGNQTLKAEESGNIVYHMKNNAKCIDWSRSTIYEVNTNDNFTRFWYSNIKKVIYNVNPMWTGDSTLFPFGDQIEEVVFNVTGCREGIGFDVTMLQTSGLDTTVQTYVPKVFVKSDITDMDTQLARNYTRQSSSSMEGYVEWRCK